MRRIVIAVAVLTALGAGQYIEKYIPLPDSFGSINVYDDSCWFVEDVASGRVFYGVEDRRFLLVLAPATGQRIGRVELGGYLYGPIGYNPDAHKLYCTAGDRYITACSLLVLDCASGARRAAIPTGVGHALGFCHSTATGKVYVLLSNRSVLVVDGRSDSLLSLITPRPPVWSPMAYSPVSNKLYIPGLDTLLVFDGAGDTLLRKVYLGADWETGPMTWNPNANTVWCVLAEEESLLVIDCATDSIVAVRQLSRGETHAVVCDTANRRVYCPSNGGELLVLDAMTATVDTVLDDWHHYPRRLAVSPALGKLYVVDDMHLRILDDSSYAVLNEFLIDPAGIGVVAGGSRVFSVYYGRLYVVDGAGDSIMTEVALSWNVTPLCFNPADGRVYGTEWYQSQLVAIDGAAAAVADVWDVPWDLRPEVAVCCSLTNRLFSASEDANAGVFDCPAESIVELPADLQVLLCHDDVRHRVYYRGRDYDFVGIDCRTLEEASRVRLPFPVVEAVADGQRGRLYLRGPSLFAAYDVVADSLVWTSPNANPGAMALDTRDNLLFVRGQDSLNQHNFLVLDCADGSIDTAISGMTGSPVELVYDKNLNRVYARSSDNNVNIVDCASRSVVHTVYLGFVARDLVLDQTRERLYVHSYETYPAPPTCAVVDGRTGDVLARLGLDHRWFDVYNRPVFDWRHGRLYGASGNEGGITVIRDTTPIGIAERSLTPNASRITPEPTIVRGVLMGLRPTAYGSRQELLNAAGRKVMELRAGDNDVSHLAPGVYFVRRASSVRREASSVTKVVITR